MDPSDARKMKRAAMKASKAKDPSGGSRKIFLVTH